MFTVNKYTHTHIIDVPQICIAGFLTERRKAIGKGHVYWEGGLEDRYNIFASISITCMTFTPDVTKIR